MPGNYARFQVSSKHLALASDYFKRMLKNGWAEGNALSTKGFADIPVNDCEPDILLIVLNLMHGLTTDFFQCHEVVGMAAGKWIKALKPLFSTSFSEDTKKWMMIAWVFNSKDILQQTETIAMQQGKGSFKTSNLPIPNSIKDKIDKARQEYMDLLQVNIAARIQDLLMTPSTGPYGHSSCQPECGAVYVGLILRTLNEMKISYSAGIPSTLPSRRHAPLFTVSFGRLSPISINTMVNGWKLTSTYYGRCSIDGNPFGTDVKRAAQNLPTSLPNSEILPSK